MARGSGGDPVGQRPPLIRYPSGLLIPGPWISFCGLEQDDAAIPRDAAIPPPPISWRHRCQTGITNQRMDPEQWCCLCCGCCR